MVPGQEEHCQGTRTVEAAQGAAEGSEPTRVPIRVSSSESPLRVLFRVFFRVFSSECVRQGLLGPGHLVRVRMLHLICRWSAPSESYPSLIRVYSY